MYFERGVPVMFGINIPFCNHYVKGGLDLAAKKHPNFETGTHILCLFKKG
jgi:hypothetical protein